VSRVFILRQQKRSLLVWLSRFKLGPLELVVYSLLGHSDESTRDGLLSTAVPIVVSSPDSSAVLKRDCWLQRCTLECRTISLRKLDFWIVRQALGAFFGSHHGDQTQLPTAIWNCFRGSGEPTRVKGASVHSG